MFKLGHYEFSHSLVNDADVVLFKKNASFKSRISNYDENVCTKRMTIFNTVFLLTQAMKLDNFQRS